MVLNKHSREGVNELSRTKSNITALYECIPSFACSTHMSRGTRLKDQDDFGFSQAIRSQPIKKGCESQPSNALLVTWPSFRQSRLVWGSVLTFDDIWPAWGSGLDFGWKGHDWFLDEMGISSIISLSLES